MPTPAPARRQLGVAQGVSVPPCPCRQHGQLHIPSPSPHHGGGDQQVRGEAQVLLHLQDVPAAADVALQRLRQLRG